MATYTYDTATAIGKVRLNLGDTDVSSSGANAVFSNEEIEVFLDQEESDNDRATGRAILSIATNQARRYRAYRSGMLSQEMAISDLIRLAEKWLEGVVENQPWIGGFEMDSTDAAFRDRVINDAIQDR